MSFTADNATHNDTQTTALSKHDNSFERCNRVRCFAHTLNLAAKAILKPFYPRPKRNDAEPDSELPVVSEEEDDDEEDIPELESVSDDGEDQDWGDDVDEDDEEEDEEGNESEGLEDKERLKLLNESRAGFNAVQKVCT